MAKARGHSERHLASAEPSISLPAAAGEPQRVVPVLPASIEMQPVRAVQLRSPEATKWSGSHPASAFAAWWAAGLLGGTPESELNS